MSGRALLGVGLAILTGAATALGGAGCGRYGPPVRERPVAAVTEPEAATDESAGTTRDRSADRPPDERTEPSPR